MVIIKGMPVSEGVAIGPLRFFDKEPPDIRREEVAAAEDEAERFESARRTACAQLDELYRSALDKVGEENAAILDIQKMMLDDPDFIESVTGMIREQNVNAEFAVGQTAQKFSQLFTSMDDAYMKERAADVLDISDRVHKALNPESFKPFELRAPSILAANDIAPSEAVQFDRDMILGFVTAEGSALTHTAILARSMLLPAVVGTDTDITAVFDEKPAILDGFTGTLYIEPDDATNAEMAAKLRETRKRQEALDYLKDRPSLTLDGTRVSLFANLSNVSDLDRVLDSGAEGIGLFRSEFLYLESEDYPTEDEQFAAYKKVAEGMGGKRVVIRTLDIGADKRADYFDLPDEVNPAMGLRAIRICLARPEIFKTQLRAIYRASAYGNVAIMFPMVVSVGEVGEALRIADEVRADLRREGVAFDENAERGLMIETPAAAMISDELAKMADFLCIGTNDLTQYTLAIDRENSRLGHLYDPRHPAILKMIGITVEAAHEAGIPVGICGELGADTSLTETFLRMGLDELSVSAGMVLPLREKVTSLDLSKREGG